MNRPSTSDLTACFQDTLYFSLGSELTRETEAAAQSSTVYEPGFVSAKLHALSNTEIRIEEGTSFAVAKRFAGNSRVAVLNFANPHYPGGGVASGAMAQEECLCRSSNLYPCLNREPVLTDFYRYHREKTDYFFSDRLIYTRDVTVFKDDSLLPQYLPREEWFRVDVITCAAPFLAQRKYTNRAALKQTFKSRIRNILETAIDNGAEVLVLGAFGCGAFKNPPEVVAAAFREVLQEGRYHSAFQKVVFAIKRTVNAPGVCPNLTAFQLAFNRFSGEVDKMRRASGLAPVCLPGGRVMKNDSENNAYYVWRERNPYFGKQFSVLGDSISTLEGFNPRGFHVFYQGQTCEQTGVREMQDTWWGKIIDFFGGELLVSNAWSGSRVTSASGKENMFPAGCSVQRAGGLHIGSVMPDVILVYMGINDWVGGVSVNDRESCGMRSNTLFDCAYGDMLRQVRKNYPKAEIWCCTLSESYMELNPSFRFPSAYGGIDIRQYNQVIRECAKESGCRCLDIHSLGEPYDSVDGTHPTAKGMDTLAWAVLASLNDGEIQALLGREVMETTGPIPEISKAAEENSCTLSLWLKAENRAVRLQGERLLVGRSTDCDLRLSSPYAARYQATFIREGSNWFLRDNNSKNGTYVNGIRLEAGELVLLKQGDSISFARKEEVEIR